MPHLSFQVGLNWKWRCESIDSRSPTQRKKLLLSREQENVLCLRGSQECYERRSGIRGKIRP